MVHEVSQPLSGLLAAAEIALSRLAGHPPRLDAARQSLAVVIELGYRTADVARNVGDLARKRTPVVADVGLNDVVKRAVDCLRAEMHRHEIVVETVVARRLPRVAGNCTQLERLVVNLVSNAIGAMREVQGRPRKLRISTGCDQAGDVLVAVEDSGSGIDPAQVDHMFAPFFTTKRDGMGVGLSICRSIVDSHGGRLWAAPALPHGSIFSFSIPPARR